MAQSKRYDEMPQPEGLPGGRRSEKQNDSTQGWFPAAHAFSLLLFYFFPSRNLCNMLLLPGRLVRESLLRLERDSVLPLATAGHDQTAKPRLGEIPATLPSR